LTRRQFLADIGVGAAAAATMSASFSGRAEAVSENPGEIVPGQMAKIRLSVNGNEYRLLVEPRWTLLFVIREKLGLTGAKVGCERGECGACTVLIDDIPRYACMTLAVEAENRRIVTLEGLMEGERLGPVQQAFVENDAFQCGYCTPGQIMAVEGLLLANPEPTMDEIRRGVSGNLCRCGAYKNIFGAAQQAARSKKG
jgi:xanthine dehydrogenase YagT iron-sulfur-binding subunit